LVATDLENYRELLRNPDTAGYQQVLELLVTDLSAARGCFWLEKGHDLLYCGDDELYQKFPFSRQAVDAVLDHGRSFYSYDTRMDERLDPTGSIKVNNVRSCLCAACYQENGRVLVIAYFDNSVGKGLFSEKDLSTLREVLSLVPGAMPVLV
jgi:hypothetical protein